ncbi:bacillithiol biosynthesis cysteine-adding enzyme BshC [Cohnella sp. GCM10027633]|uniref:bacillithiol biosynthesis cysteine-adding enzyme BshC n=1 Tax=unclassified Cohnella TaxID=2636738 RepID=UPI00362779AF
MNIAPLAECNDKTIAERFRQGCPEATELFGLHPSEEDHWRRRASTLDATADRRASMAGVAEAIRSYQAELPAHAEAARSVAKLASGEALVVVGGQQAGLYGGALLIFYKALTVVQTARYAEKLLGRPVVPVFWIAGEDHDYDEANHVNIQAADGGVRRLRIDRPDGPRLAVSRTSLTAADWQASLLELAAQLPDTEHKPELLAKLQSYVSDAPTLSLAFARLLADWFGGQGLLLLDADDPALRALEGPMFRRLVERNDELELALKTGEKRVGDRGFPLQAEIAEYSANLFLHHEQGRLLLHKDGGRFVDRRGNVAYGAEELLALTDSAPELLSTNALTRPLMQDYLLPVLGAVLGPSELAYWGILGPAFESFGMSMPLLVPRQSFTYLPHNIGKLMDKYELSIEAVLHEWADRKAQWLSRQDRWNVEEKFQQAREQFERLYAPVMDTVGSLQPGLAKLAESNRDKIIEQMSYLESRSLDAIAKQNEAALRQWDRIQLALTPLGKPQERVYGTIHYWNRYGPAWLTQWLNVPYEVTGGQRLVESLVPVKEQV